MGRHLGIDFPPILLDFGCQVTVENRAIIDPKRHRTSDENKKVTKMAKKSVQERMKHRARGFPEPQGVLPYKAGQPLGAAGTGPPGL